MFFLPLNPCSFDICPPPRQSQSFQKTGYGNGGTKKSFFDLWTHVLLTLPPLPHSTVSQFPQGWLQKRINEENATLTLKQTKKHTNFFFHMILPTGQRTKFHHFCSILSEFSPSSHSVLTELWWFSLKMTDFPGRRSRFSHVWSVLGQFSLNSHSILMRLSVSSFEILLKLYKSGHHAGKRTVRWLLHYFCCRWRSKLILILTPQFCWRNLNP